MRGGTAPRTCEESRKDVKPSGTKKQKQKTPQIVDRMPVVSSAGPEAPVQVGHNKPRRYGNQHEMSSSVTQHTAHSTVTAHSRSTQSQHSHSHSHHQSARHVGQRDVDHTIRTLAGDLVEAGEEREAKFKSCSRTALEVALEVLIKGVPVQLVPVDVCRTHHPDCKHRSAITGTAQ